ncbi:MAG: hypothetical protein Q8K57_07430, partial [Thiobacillus sp.]|nr:hypothetical protein [Thiobacillus sp.]
MAPQNKVELNRQFPLRVASVGFKLQVSRFTGGNSGCPLFLDIRWVGHVAQIGLFKEMQNGNRYC